MTCIEYLAKIRRQFIDLKTLVAQNSLKLGFVVRNEVLSFLQNLFKLEFICTDRLIANFGQLSQKCYLDRTLGRLSII